MKTARFPVLDQEFFKYVRATLASSRYRVEDDGNFVNIVFTGSEDELDTLTTSTNEAYALSSILWDFSYEGFTLDSLLKQMDFYSDPSNCLRYSNMHLYKELLEALKPLRSPTIKMGIRYNI